MKSKFTFLFLSVIVVSHVQAQSNHASWVELLETTGEMSNLNDVITDGTDIYINGVYQGSGSFLGSELPQYEANNAVIAKIETDGTLIWTATMASEGMDAFFDIKLDTDGNIIATGYSGQGDSDIMINGISVVPNDGITNNVGIVAKFSGLDGSLIWEKHWFSAVYANANSVKLAVDEQENVLVGGYFSGNFEVDDIQVTYNQNFGNDLFLLKINASGEAQWIQTFESETDGGYATIKGVETNESAVIFAFEYSKPLIIDGNPLPHEGDFYWNGVAKLNKNTGAVENLMTFGSTTGGQGINQIRLDANDNIFITGFFSANTGFEIGTIALDGYGQDDGFIAKLDPELNVLWAKQMGGEYLDRAFNLTVTASNNMLIGGSFDNLAPFQFDGAQILESSTSSSLNMFELLIDGDGNYINVFSLLGYDPSAVLSNNRTAILANGDMFTAGNFNGAVDFTGDNPIFTEHQRGFVIKWAENIALSMPDDFMVENFEVYPNPFLDKITINSTGDDRAQLTLLDLTGKLIQTEYISTNTVVNLSGIPGGIYLLSIQSGRQTKTVKVVKM